MDRAQDQPEQLGSELEVVVGAGPSPNLFPEIRLVKPALLYADRVILFSPMANLLAGIAAASQAEGVDRAQIMIDMAEALGEPNTLEMMQAAQALLAVDSLPRAQRRKLMGPKAKEARHLAGQLDEAWEELRRKVDDKLSEAGAEELDAALESGIVHVEPLFDENQPEFEDLLEIFVGKLADVLTKGRAFPLFDDQTGSLVAAGVAEGLFAPSEESLRRGREIGAAAQFMSYLPAFPLASVGDVLDIREHLREPLTQFRRAMVKTARLIDSVPFEPDFALQVEDLYREQVAPAIEEIRYRVEANAYLRQLGGEAVKDIPKWLGRGFLALAVTPWTDLPALVVAGATAVEPTAKAAWAKYKEGKQIRQDQYYFLYETDRLLS